MVMQRMIVVSQAAQAQTLHKLLHVTTTSSLLCRYDERLTIDKSLVLAAATQVQQLFQHAYAPAI
jgi:hypothetical protein